MNKAVYTTSVAPSRPKSSESKEVTHGKERIGGQKDKQDGKLVEQREGRKHKGTDAADNGDFKYCRFAFIAATTRRGIMRLRDGRTNLSTDGRMDWCPISALSG